MNQEFSVGEAVGVCAMRPGEESIIIPKTVVISVTFWEKNQLMYDMGSYQVRCSKDHWAYGIEDSEFFFAGVYLRKLDDDKDDYSKHEEELLKDLLPA